MQHYFSLHLDIEYISAQVDREMFLALQGDRELLIRALISALRAQSCPKALLLANSV